MKKFQAYDIIHVNLHEKDNLSLPGTSNGKYIIIWWNEIAVGQFFIEPGATVDHKEDHSRIVSAIINTIKFYTNDTSDENNWEDWLLNHTIKDWKLKLQNIFCSLTPEKYPGTVPVSVIICTRNRPESLHQCLQSFINSVCKPEEIIVVDNAPSDKSTYQIVTQFENIIYVKEPIPGLDIARNTGIKRANAPIVAFIDDDVQVHKLWMYHVFKSFKSEAIAATAGLVIAAHLQTEAQYIFEKHWSFNRGYVDKIYGQNFFESTLKNGPPVWEIGAGANMAFRRSIFEEAGYFNELLDAGAAGCNGDSEMWYRILTKGYSIAYNPRAIVFHEHRKEIKALKNQIFYYMRGFTVAALLQQLQSPFAGYKKHLFVRLPRYYFNLLRSGFPFYRGRFQTLSAEMKGILSGLRYYYKNFKDGRIH